jgi:hypothetical protein
MRKHFRVDTAMLWALRRVGRRLDVGLDMPIDDREGSVEKLLWLRTGWRAPFVPVARVNRAAMRRVQLAQTYGDDNRRLEGSILCRVRCVGDLIDRTASG